MLESAEVEAGGHVARLAVDVGARGIGRNAAPIVGQLADSLTFGASAVRE